MAKNIDNKLVFLRVSDSNVAELSEDISDIHLAVLGQECSRAYWSWSYLENPAGKSNTIVAIRDGRVVGKFGSVYLRMIVQGELTVAAALEGLCIEPNERSWNCFAGLLEKSYDGHIEDNVAFCFGFANPVSKKLTQQTGGTRLCRAPIYSGFLNISKVLSGRLVPYPLSLTGWLAQPFVGLKTSMAGDSDLDIRFVDHFDISFDKLWSAVEQRRTVAVIKDAVYLNWRYVKCPDRKYLRFAAYRDGELEGFVVFSAVDNRYNSYVFELIARDDNSKTMKTLLLKTFQELRTQGAGLVTASFPAESRASAVLKKAGFKSWGARLWDMDLMVTTDPRKKSCPELSLKNWDFSLGDWLYQ